MRTPACLLLTLTVVAPAPQPTPPPPQSSLTVVAAAPQPTPPPPQSSLTVVAAAPQPTPPPPQSSLTVVAAAPQPTPPPTQSSSPSPPQHSLGSPFTNCIELDISEIEELRWKLNNTIDFDLTGKKEMISLGLLEEDWFRLKLLEDRLPVDSLLKPKLLKLFRLMISALFQAHKPSVQLPKTNHTLFENNQLNRTVLNPPNISNNLLNPTIVNQSNVLSMTTTIADGTDNVAAESELQESVLPFNTFASPYPIETTTTLHSKDTDLKFNFDKKVNQESTSLKLPDELPTDDHSVKVDDINSEHTTNYAQKQNNTQKYDPMKTGETISIIQVDSGTNTVYGTEITKITTANEEKTSLTSLETEISRFSNIEGSINDKSSVVYETTGINNEATFTPETNKNPIEEAEKDHGTPYDETKSRGGASEVNNNVDNSSSNIVSSETSSSRDSTIQPSPSQDDISQYQHTSNPTDSSSSTERHVDNYDQSINTISYSDQPNYSTTILSNSKYFNDTTKENYNDSIRPVNLTVTSENNFREDDSLHSTTFNPLSSTSSRSMTTSLNKTMNETFHSFTAVFPEYPKLTSPAIKVNTLTIYPPDRSQRVIFPLVGPRVPPRLQVVCKNKNTCVKVQNIKFNNPQNYGRFIKPNSGTSSEDIRFYNTDAKSDHKRWDAENILWWQKIRILRKKSS